MKTAIVLAAGKGTRMKSRLPKVLHKVAGLPMIVHVMRIMEATGFEKIIPVLGYGKDEIAAVLPEGYEPVVQEEQLGTGHAVLQCISRIPEEGSVLVICGDTPLIKAETIDSLEKVHRDSRAAVTVLTAMADNPYGYGRIIRGEGGIEAIREEKDADEAEKEIREINTGTYFFDAGFLKKELVQLSADNSQGEYYLTDLVEKAVNTGLTAAVSVLGDFSESLGINNRIQLAEAEKTMNARKIRELMLSGVTITDPDSVSVGWDVQVGMDTVLFRGTVLEGGTVIGEGCTIGPYTVVTDSFVGSGSTVRQSSLNKAHVGKDCNVGPYAHLRPAAELKEGVKAGSFTEIKKSVIGKGSKVPHLSYLGDALVGENANIGCGTITCNYDGINKSITRIEDGAFIGSNTNLIAPVTVGEKAYIAAGSTITSDVPAGDLGIARGRQRNIVGWNDRKSGNK